MTASANQLSACLAEGKQWEDTDLIPEECDKESTLSKLTPVKIQEHAELVYFRNNGFEIQNALKY